jgi:hypothetical protein
MDIPKPIFVFGSPRSGTSMIGAYVGTGDNILDLGEYAGFDFTHRIARKELSNMPSNFIRGYIEDLKGHAREYANQLSIQAGMSYFCDSAPWNLLSLETIADSEKDAIFIICLRNARAVIQSLKKSYEAGWTWCGSSIEHRIRLWGNFYKNIIFLPRNRTIVFNYDNFCINPSSEINSFTINLKELGLNNFQIDTFCISHASENNSVPIAHKGEDGKVHFRSKNNYDESKWSHEDEAILRSSKIYNETQKLLKKFIPSNA